MERRPSLPAGFDQKPAGKDGRRSQGFSEGQVMSEKQKTVCDPFNDLADFKKRVLKGVKSAVDSMVDHEINATDSRLENARRMREEWRREATEEEAPPNPT